MSYLCLLVMTLFIHEYNSLSHNNSAVLITKYAKVARWGLGNQNSSGTVQEGRSHNAPNSWNPRSNLNSRRSETIKKPQVVYHYAITNKQANLRSKIGSNLKTDRVPGVGEVVIQDRFNPRPYFQYSQVPSGQYNSKPEQYPVYKPPEASKPPAVDLYTSPFNSYNPPVAKPTDNAQNLPIFPPNTPPQDTYAAPPTPETDMKPSLGPPLAPSDAPSKDAPPNFPPKDEHDVYYPPEDNDDHQHDDMGMDDMPKQAPMDDHPPPNDDQQDFYPPNHPEVILDHPPAGYKPDMAEDDMQPPPADPHLKFPTYLYDHGYDHHVYEEIPHTTTPKPEKQRVSSAHYSYAHIGRKLWYVPLFFSVYFIIYVTVLIIKSIVRHKVEFKHHFERESRALSGEEELNRLHEDVSRGIESATHQYSYIM